MGLASRLSQESAHGSPADAEAPGNLTFADSIFSECPNQQGVLCDSRWPPVGSAFLACLSDAGFHPVT